MKVLLGGTQLIDVALMAKVNVNQFYGIEIEEFPAQIAQVAMWLIDHQMNMKMSEEFGLYFVRLPLIAKANIIIDNALKLDWKTIIANTDVKYILGNPPFIGSSMMDSGQKDDMQIAFQGFGKTGQLDYVTAWYYKAANFIQNTDIKVGFVSTNSICQGEQAILLWPFLMKERNIEIFFAHQTFKWSNEAAGKAAVNVIIIGFHAKNSSKKTLFYYNSFDSLPSTKIVQNINHYLIDAPSIFIKPRTTPLCNVPPMIYGTKPTDGGNFIFTEDEMMSFIESEPRSAKYFIPFIGAEDMIQGFKRYCLYLKYCPSSEIYSMPNVKKRVQNVANIRKASRKLATQKMAQYPTLMGEDRYSPTDILVIPSVSSENRAYVPIGYYKSPAMCNNSSFQISNADLYTFGVFVSSMHMAWMRTVCGRLESRYRYSNTIVYNNFIWPEPTEKQKKSIEFAAKAILNARDLYPELTLAKLYDSITMPPELVKAHNRLDAEVEKAYGQRFNSDADRVAFLFEKYAELVRS